MIMNLSDEPRAVATAARRIVLATHDDGTTVDQHGVVTLPPLAGALAVHP
jgi:hypothetical protein